MRGRKVREVELHFHYVGGTCAVPGSHDERGVSSRIVLVHDQVPSVSCIRLESIRALHQCFRIFEPTIFEGIYKSLFFITESPGPEHVHAVEFFQLYLIQLGGQFNEFLVVVLSIRVGRGHVQCPCCQGVHAIYNFSDCFQRTVLNLGIRDEVLEVLHRGNVSLVSGTQLCRLPEPSGIVLGVLHTFARRKLGNGRIQLHPCTVSLEGETSQIMVYMGDHNKSFNVLSKTLGIQLVFSGTNCTSMRSTPTSLRTIDIIGRNPYCFNESQGFFLPTFGTGRGQLAGYSIL